MTYRYTWSAALVAAMIATPAAARTITVKVDARAMPWQPAANPKLPFGRGDGRRPAIVMGFRLISGTKVKFAATGTTTTVAGGPAFGPGGQQDFPTGQAPGNSGTFFPSRHFDPAALPAYLNQLVGAFVDADGRVVGRPFAIGTATMAIVPEGAAAIDFGINDDIFADNAGAIEVVVSYVEGKVEVE